MILAFFAASLIALTAGTGFAGGSPQEEANKQVVVDFYEKALNQKGSEATSRHLGAKQRSQEPFSCALMMLGEACLAGCNVNEPEG